MKTLSPRKPRRKCSSAKRRSPAQRWRHFKNKRNNSESNFNKNTKRRLRHCRNRPMVRNRRPNWRKKCAAKRKNAK